MVDIVVIRGEGDKDGGLIESPLINTVEVALVCGRNAVDSNSKSRTVTVLAIHRPGMRLGNIVEIHDSLVGEVWRGKVIGISVSQPADIPILELKVQRPIP